MKTAATHHHSQKAIAPILRNADATRLDCSQKAIAIWRKKLKLFFSIPIDLIAIVSIPSRLNVVHIRACSHAPTSCAHAAAQSFPKPIKCGAHQGVSACT